MALTQQQLVELNSKMNQVYNLEDVKSLCFAMDIDFDSLGGEGKGGKIRELIAFCQRRGRIDELAARVQAVTSQAASASPSGGGNQYNYSAHADGGGSANVTNYIGGSPQPAQPAQPQPQPQPAKKITILFLAANPTDTKRLRLDEEVRTIDERLRQAQYRDRFNLEQQWAVRTGDILDAMLRYKPDIVHFSGHGSADGALIFEDASGAAKPVSAAALGALFEALEGVRCVVMNACWSNTHATQIAKFVDCVVGMARSVSDDAAIGFAAGFYRSLGEGKSVAAAFKLGKAQIMIDGSTEQKTPQLKARPGVDPASVTFA